MRIVLEGCDCLLESDGLRLCLLRPKGLLARATGLLNHLSLPESEGLLFGRSLVFHTFGMRFPILMLSLSRSGRLMAEPRIVLPGKIFWAPLRAAHLAEVHPVHLEHFMRIWALDSL